MVQDFPTIKPINHRDSLEALSRYGEYSRYWVISKEREFFPHRGFLYIFPGGATFQVKEQGEGLMHSIDGRVWLTQTAPVARQTRYTIDDRPNLQRQESVSIPPGTELDAECETPTMLLYCTTYYPPEVNVQSPLHSVQPNLGRMEHSLFSRYISVVSRLTITACYSDQPGILNSQIGGFICLAEGSGAVTIDGRREEMVVGKTVDIFSAFKYALSATNGSIIIGGRVNENRPVTGYPQK